MVSLHDLSFIISSQEKYSLFSSYVIYCNMLFLPFMHILIHVISMQGNGVDARMDCIPLLLFSCAFPVNRAGEVEKKIRGMIG